METEPSCKKMDTVVKLDSVSSVFKSLCNLDSESFSKRDTFRADGFTERTNSSLFFNQNHVAIALKDIVTLCNIMQFVFLPSALMRW